MDTLKEIQMQLFGSYQDGTYCQHVPVVLSPSKRSVQL